MGLFAKRPPDDRSSLLSKAARARARGRRKKAIVLYQRALALDDSDHEVHAKLAPLLAEARQPEPAWRSFVAAAQGFHRKGFVDKSLGVYRQATRYFAHDVELWERVADLEMQRGHRADAIKTLLQGRHHFRRRSERPQALQLLRLAVEIQPYHLHATRQLSALLWKMGERAEALDLLEALALHSEGRALRQVRARLLWLRPSPAALWRWLRAVFAGR